MMTIATAFTAKPVLVGMGQSAATRDDGTLAALLGSCVGIALYHRRLRVAALAHVVLADSAGETLLPGKFADTAVPHLIELLVAEGANMGGLMAKITGGASMFGTPGPNQIGEKNTVGVLAALKKAGIPCVAQHVGGTKGRRIVFEVATCDAKVEIAGQQPIVV